VAPGLVIDERFLVEELVIPDSTGATEQLLQLNHVSRRGLGFLGHSSSSSSSTGIPSPWEVWLAFAVRLCN